MTLKSHKNKKRKKKLENFYKQNQYALNNNSLKNIQFISSNSKDNSNDNSEIKTFNNNNIERNIPFIEKENVTPKNLFSEKKNITENKPIISNTSDSKKFENSEKKNEINSFISNNNEDFLSTKNNNNKKENSKIINNKQNDMKNGNNDIIENENLFFKEHFEENNNIPICTKYKLYPPIEKLCALRENELKNINNFSIFDEEKDIIISFLNPVNLNYVNIDELNIDVNYDFSINNFDPDCPLKKILGPVSIEILNTFIQDENDQLLNIYLHKFKTNKYEYNQDEKILSLSSDLRKIIK